jgi:hypothetical protein
MTTEDLHSKHDIAEELAVRDKRVATLTRERDEARASAAHDRLLGLEEAAQFCDEVAARAKAKNLPARERFAHEMAHDLRYLAHGDNGDCNCIECVTHAEVEANR